MSASKALLRSRVGRVRRSPLLRRRQRLFPLFVYPAMIVYGVVVVVPTIYTFWISLQKWPGAGPMKPVGFKNYVSLMADPAFGQSFRNTLFLLFGVGAATFGVSFLLTMIMHDMSGRKAVRSIIFFPNIVPGVAIAIYWGFLFQPDGLVNRVIGLFGIKPFPWLAQSNLLGVVSLGMMWIATGLFTVIFMAAADQIPKELYEAARLEGASPLQSFRMITMPLLRDTIAVCAVLWALTAIKAFDFIIAFTSTNGGLPPREVWNFAVFTYGAAFGQNTRNYGMASASGVLMLLMAVVLIWFSRRISGKEAITY